MLQTLRTDFQRIPELLALGAPEQPEPIEPMPELEALAELVPEPDEPPAVVEPEPAAQLGLF
jgi:hypothetical protein